MGSGPDRTGAFSEKAFYLAEFRGRTLAFALQAPDVAALEAVEEVLAELGRNHTRALLLSPDRPVLEKLAGGAVISAADPRWVGGVWRGLWGGDRVGLAVAPEEELAVACRRVSLRLRLAKLVWLDSQGGLRGPGGERLSFIDMRGLEELAARDAAPLLAEIRALLAEGFPSVNLCTPEGLAAELFSYAGSGTLFTRERYTEVRYLALDEFDAACDLVQRGVREGYLVPRSEQALEEILSSAFGVFVEGRFLAGIGALLPHPEQEAGEIASLYTLTRFLGEGVGAHLVGFALERARAAGYRYVFACTTSDRVRSFFERNGFRPVDISDIPPEKWSGYDPERRARICCLRFDLI
jgi:N-acetylglutamate synthase-like GNAT family acetyltransferase